MLWEGEALELIWELHLRENTAAAPPHPPPACQGRTGLAHLFQSWEVRDSACSLEAGVLIQGGPPHGPSSGGRLRRWASRAPRPAPVCVALCCLHPGALHDALCTSSIFLTLLHSFHASSSSFIFFFPWALAQPSCLYLVPLIVLLKSISSSNYFRFHSFEPLPVASISQGARCLIRNLDEVQAEPGRGSCLPPGLSYLSFKQQRWFTPITWHSRHKLSALHTASAQSVIIEWSNQLGSLFSGLDSSLTHSYPLSHPTLGPGLFLLPDFSSQSNSNCIAYFFDALVYTVLN